MSDNKPLVLLQKHVQFSSLPYQGLPLWWICCRFFFPALGGLLYGYDIGATSGATISLKVTLCPLALISQKMPLYSLRTPAGSTLLIYLSINLLLQSSTFSGTTWYNLSSVQTGLVVMLYSVSFKKIIWISVRLDWLTSILLLNDRIAGYAWCRSVAHCMVLWSALSWHILLQTF